MPTIQNSDQSSWQGNNQQLKQLSGTKGEKTNVMELGNCTGAWRTYHIKEQLPIDLVMKWRIRPYAAIKDIWKQLWDFPPRAHDYYLVDSH